jgi:hypothetical protein
MLNCPILTGEYRGHEFHQGSQRMIVTFLADGRNEPETVWSERTDTLLGAAQARYVRALPKGCRVRIWKHTRQIDQTKKVRDMLHVERLHETTESQPAETPADAPPASAGPPNSEPAESTAGADREGAAPAASTQIPLDYDGAIERLTGAQRVKVARWAHDELHVSIHDADKLSAEQKNSILAYCELVIGGMA